MPNGDHTDGNAGNPGSDSSNAVLGPEAIKVPVMAGTGEGRLPAALNGTLMPTPGTANANIVAIVVQPLIALLVRAGHLFFITFTASITAAQAAHATGGPVLLASIDLKTAAWLALSAVVVGAAKDCITIFARLESKYPLMTGNV